METTKPRAHVVIVGGGFAGLGCARRLAKSGDVQVTLIDKNNYHQFQPLLYQVATAELASSNVATSLRQSLRGHANVNVKMAEVMVADPLENGPKLGEVGVRPKVARPAGVVIDVVGDDAQGGRKSRRRQH